MLLLSAKILAGGISGALSREQHEGCSKRGVIICGEHPISPIAAPTSASNEVIVARPRVVSSTLRPVKAGARHTPAFFWGRAGAGLRRAQEAALLLQPPREIAQHRELARPGLPPP